MTGSKHMVRCRRRHKVQRNLETLDSEGVTTLSDVEESLPSTSSSLIFANHHHHQHHQQKHNRQDRSPSEDNRISNYDDDYTQNPEDVEIIGMRRRRIIIENGRSRPREMISEDVTSSDSLPSTSSPPTFHSSTSKSPYSPSRRSERVLLAVLTLCAIFQPTTAFTEVRCGPIDIRNKPWSFRAKYSTLGDSTQHDSFYNLSTFPTYPPSRYSVPCTVIEGSLSISFIYSILSADKIQSGRRDPEDKELVLTDYPMFPNLREITGTLLIFETNGLTDLGYVFPNLRVIGGQKLVQHFSLIIYRNNDLLKINMPKLSVIRHGGVRVQDNRKCCHTQSIGWKNMIQSTVNDVIVDRAADYAVTETGIVCQKGPCEDDPTGNKCNYLHLPGDTKIQSCWSNTTCQKACAYNRLENGTFGPGCAPNGAICHEQCIGGCDKPNSDQDCSACRNVYHNGKCIEKCPEHLYLLMNRRCVTKEECLSLNPKQKLRPVWIKATAGICSDVCPSGWELNPADPSVCSKCDGTCEKKCPVMYKIDTFGRAQSLEHCNIIEGNLTIEIRGKTDSGMAAKLKTFFADIHTITGYLTVLRSPPLLSLGMFKKLKMVRGDSLYMNQFAISVIDNQNLRQLFEENTQVRIGNPAGTIQVHNNRMLCFSVIEKLVAQLGVPLNETFQSVASNGDKAICQDANIDIFVETVGSDSITFTWDPFDTSDSDFRKFLGYELFFKEVEKPDPKMSIDDDRSACVDSWNSVFVQHMEPQMDYSTIGHNVTQQPKERIRQIINAANNRIRPNTVYAYYVATQMVHHPGAKNGMSKIGFVKTGFTLPEPPVLTVTGVETDSITITWEPPRRANGDITHYTIAWRELDVDVHAEALKLCDKQGSGIATNYQSSIDESLNKPDETLKTSENPAANGSSLKDFLTKQGNDTCSALKGCCVCATTDLPPTTVAPNEDTINEQTNFENGLLDAIITNIRCDYEKDPIGCAMRAHTRDAHIIYADDESTKEDVNEGGEKDSEDVRIKRNTEAMERRRRQILMGDEESGGTHAIRGADRRQYEQFTALIIDSARRRRSIQEAEEKNKEMGKPEKSRIQVTKGPPRTTVAGSTVATPTLETTQEDDKKKKKEILLDEIYFAGGRFEINVTAKEAENMFTLRNLTHFTKYAITVSACQNMSVENAGCSWAHKAATEKRTLHRNDIDRIDPNTIKVEPISVDDDEEFGNLRVTWDEAKETNGGVLGYLVAMSMPGATGNTVCVGNVKGFSTRTEGAVFKKLSEGLWSVQVETISAYSRAPPVVWSGAYEVTTPSFWLWWRLAGAALTIFLSIIIIAGIVFYNVKYKFGKRVKKLADFMHLNPEYCVDEKYTADDWELADKDVSMGAIIGEGTFGKVHLGMGNNLTSVRGDKFGPCAIKVNSGNDANSPENMNYLMEANVMKNFKANFVVKLYGVISSCTPAKVVMEYMELGNLRDYLRSKRQDEVFDENNCNFYDVVPRAKLCEWAAQVCDGMAYLESLKFCHRDLAARNCMIDKNELVKIGDFGMARDLFYHDYYKPSGKRMMPVRWMSPESLKDGKFDSKSDVWAFGVVLYEIVSLGAQPYIGLSNDEVLNYIGMARKVIKQPDCCSDYWYKIMKMCWRYSPRDRPTFLQLVHLLSAEASEEFKTLSFVFTENQMAMEDADPLDLEDIFAYHPPVDEENMDPAAMDLIVAAEEGRRNTDSMMKAAREFSSDQIKEGNSHSTVSSVGSTVKPGKKGPRQRSLDDEYTMMNHNRAPSDPAEHRPYTGDQGDYVERDVAADVPTRRNTGNSNCSYTGGFLTSRGGSNERNAGFGEGLRLTDGIGSGHHLHDDDYGDGLLSSMDTRRSTGASTASYGVPHQTNWSGSQTKGATYFENKKAAAAKAAQAEALAARQKAQLLAEGRGDRLVQLPGLVNGSAQNGVNGVQTGGGEGDYVETEAKRLIEGSPSKNGNFNRPRTAFTERERLIEDHEN